jgi:glycosyltransferase involved in cell wall biosynthesis
VNILMLTAGTGSFHCGTCLRDNTLAHGLRSLGHTVTLVPLYLPLVTDRPDASEGQTVRLGGVTAYLHQRSALYRSLPGWVNRLLDSRAMLKVAARRAGATDPASLGPMTLSMLAGTDGHQARGIQTLTESLSELDPKPEVVLLSNALLLGLADPVREALQVPVVCTLQGEDVFLDALPPGEREAAWTLVADRARKADGLIAVSRFYAGEMARRLGMAEADIYVALNGIDPTGYEPADAAPNRPTIGFLARLCDDKGLGTLVDAYIALRQSWDGAPTAQEEDPTAPTRIPALWLGGALTAIDRPGLGDACKRLKEAHVSDALQVRPNLSLQEKQAFLCGLTVLCVPVQVGESFGLYALEAMACGVPVVAPNRGALPEVIAATGGGVVVQGDSPEAIAEAIGDLLRDRVRREVLGQAGRQAVLERFGAERMAKDVADILAEVMA